MEELHKAMASNSSVHFHVFFVIFMFMQFLMNISAFQFSITPPFNNILVGGNATKTNTSLLLTSNNRDEAGRAVYGKKIKLVYKPGGSVSFSTSFTFKITKTTPSGADGLAFFLTSADWVPPMNSKGEALGLIDINQNGNRSNKIVAVEFDTFKNLYDPSALHVGIDINSLTSKASANLTQDLYNTTVNSWVDYSSFTGILEVRLARVNETRPGRPLVSTYVGLSQVLDEEVYVGFSASTGSYTEFHEVYAWNFSSGGFNIAPAYSIDVPAPSPAYSIYSPAPSPEYSSVSSPPPSPPVETPSSSPLPNSPPTANAPQEGASTPPPTAGAPSPSSGRRDTYNTIMSLFMCFFLMFLI